MSRSSDYEFLRLAQGKSPRMPRKGRKDYHPQGRFVKSGHHPNKWERRKVIAWDGEGKTLKNGKHIYTMLSNSEGDELMSARGLHTAQLIEFMLEHNDPKAINVIFGGSYDVNMIVGDLPHREVARLWSEGSVRWFDYVIRYAHRRKFSVQRLAMDNRGRRVPVGDSFVLWDVLGFFQTNFVDACRIWLKGNDELLDEIHAMKLRRSDFNEVPLEEVRAYNDKENKLLVLMVNALFDSFDTIGLKLRRYDGAGAVAQALMERAKVAEHKVDTPGPLLHSVRCAYGGGRIEAVKIGNLEHGRVYAYDINSAYPSKALHLPSLKGLSWESGEWDGSDWSLVTVMFSVKKKDRTEGSIYPLYHRDMFGHIYYPGWVHGTYWGYEVKNLVKYWPDNFQILGARNLLLPHGNERPFQFIEDAYRHRKIFKQQGNMAEYALKLGINSVYGKTAQQAGYREGRIPAYHQLMWAGMITSATRAQMYDAAMQNPEAVIFFATDGLYTLEPLDLDIGDGLGQWSEEVYDGVTVVQAGVYWLRKEKEWGSAWVEKYRGFDKSSLVREDILEAWRRGDSTYPAPSTRFVGMGAALNGSFKDWRKWKTTERELNLKPDPYELGIKRGAGKTTCFADQLCDTMVVESPDGSYPSNPYPLLWAPDKSAASMIQRFVDTNEEWEIEESYY